MHKQDNYYKVKELADMLDVSVFTIYKWIKEGKIEHYRIFDRSRYRIPKERVKNIIQQVYELNRGVL